MTPVPIHMCSSNELFPLLAEYERQMDEVHRRAYHLFEQRGGTHGRALDDWLDAERQILCSPQAHTTDETNSYRVVTSLAGFPADRIQVSIGAQDMVIRAECTPGQGVGFSLKAMTQFRFCQPVDITRATATFEDGLLEVDVPKLLNARAA
jgi:HSP20 family molecular chaperone IbpA